MNVSRIHTQSAAQTLPKLNARVTFRKGRRKSNFALVGTDYTYGHLDMYIQDSPADIQTLNTLEPDRQQRDRPSACVIAQQYSSVTSVSLRSHCRDKNSARVLLYFYNRKYAYVGMVRTSEPHFITINSGISN